MIISGSRFDDDIIMNGIVQQEICWEGSMTHLRNCSAINSLVIALQTAVVAFVAAISVWKEMDALC